MPPIPAFSFAYTPHPCPLIGLMLPNPAHSSIGCQVVLTAADVYSVRQSVSSSTYERGTAK